MAAFIINNPIDQLCVDEIDPVRWKRTCSSQILSPSRTLLRHYIS